MVAKIAMAARPKFDEAVVVLVPAEALGATLESADTVDFRRAEVELS
jgi:hypothetical protein